MQTNIIGIKELIKNLKKVYQLINEGQEFLVVKNSRPAFKIVPIEKQTNIKKYNLKDFAQIKFTTEDKNLSQNIDKIITVDKNLNKCFS